MVRRLQLLETRRRRPGLTGRVPARPPAALLVLMLLAFPACGVRGLNFVKDERIEIVTPRDREAVDLPVTLSWRVSDFEVTGPDDNASPDAGYFGVYVDQAPQPPERDQAWLVKDDDECKRTPGCPTPEFLATRDIYSTSRTSFVIEELPEIEDDAVDRRDRHEATIVLLNGRGERIGESAFTVEFEVRRGG